MDDVIAKVPYKLIQTLLVLGTDFSTFTLVISCARYFTARVGYLFYVLLMCSSISDFYLLDASNTSAEGVINKIIPTHCVKYPHGDTAKYLLVENNFSQWSKI